MTVALVHDYLTQRGGAERVVLSLRRAFPGAPLHTALYEPATTYAEFAAGDVRTSPLDRIAVFRRDHRLALPFLAPAFSAMRVDADVAVCSSSGWAHGARAAGRKVVYCHNPARWLYQRAEYVRESPAAVRAALTALGPALRRWDRRAAASCHRYVCNSTAVRDRIRRVYGIEATVVPPPPAVDPAAPRRAVDGLEPGFFLCVSRLLPYKNVDAVVRGVGEVPDGRLVVVGNGTDRERERLLALAGSRVTFLPTVADEELRWLYASCAALVTASYEDFGLTPVEAACFGRPVAALRYGGFLDTVVEGTTGVLFDRPEPAAVAAALRDVTARDWDAGAITAHAERFGEARFVERMREVVAEEAALAG